MYNAFGDILFYWSRNLSLFFLSLPQKEPKRSSKTNLRVVLRIAINYSFPALYVWIIYVGLASYNYLVNMLFPACLTAVRRFAYGLLTLDWLGFLMFFLDSDSVKSLLIDCTSIIIYYFPLVFNWFVYVGLARVFICWDFAIF